jgi:hypothetical protein
MRGVLFFQYLVTPRHPQMSSYIRPSTEDALETLKGFRLQFRLQASARLGEPQPLIQHLNAGAASLGSAAGATLPPDTGIGRRSMSLQRISRGFHRLCCIPMKAVRREKGRQWPRANAEFSDFSFWDLL